LNQRARKAPASATLPRLPARAPACCHTEDGALFGHGADMYPPGAVGAIRYHDLMSELPAGDTHDVIRHSGQVVAVVVPIEEYRKLRQAMQEQQVNEEFDAARARYLARREAGAIRYVSHEEAGRRLSMPSR
jgi:hypothetical protein